MAAARKVSDKVDPTGNYLSFYGYTVVSMVADRQGLPQRWEDFLQNSPTFRAHVSPLPASSYHATIYDIFTQRNVPERYRAKSGAVPSPHWTKAHDNLRNDVTQAQARCEAFEGELYFTKGNLRFGNLPGNVLLVEGALSNLKKVSELAESMTIFFHGAGKPVAVHHVTLGYTFKPIDEDNRKKIDEELKGFWGLIPDCILLEKPNVCYFETMKEFIPAKSL